MGAEYAIMVSAANIAVQINSSDLRALQVSPLQILLEIARVVVQEAGS